MVKKRIWLFVLAAVLLAAAVLVGLSILAEEGEGVYKGAKLVLNHVQDAFLRMPGKVA